MKTVHLTHDSFLHRLNPLSKVLATLPVLLVVALTTDPWAPLAIIAICVLLMLSLGRTPPRRLVGVLAPLLALMVGFVVFYPLAVRPELVNDTPVVFRWGPLTLYEGGIRFGLATALRVVCLITLSLPFSLTTDPTDFIRALVQQWRLPYRIGYSAMAAFRFVPMLQTELAVIRGAHRIRGVSDKGGLVARYDQLKRYSIPLLATAIRQAERTALAMDGRAFGAFETRTFFKRQAFQLRDGLFVLGFWLACTGVLALVWRAGLLGPLVFFQAV